MRHGTTYGRSRISYRPYLAERGHPTWPLWDTAWNHGRGEREPRKMYIRNERGRETHSEEGMRRGRGRKKEETNTRRVSFVRVRRCTHTRARRLLELFRARLCTPDDSYFNFLFA